MGRTPPSAGFRTMRAASRRATRRTALVRLANVCVPGSGLVMRDRGLVGAWLAFAFTVGGVTACWGWMIVPLSIPPWLRYGGAALALAAWVTAQVLLTRAEADGKAGGTSDLPDTRRESMEPEPERA